MRITALITFLLLSLGVFAQDTTLLDNNWNKVNSKSKAKYYNVTIRDNADTSIKTEILYSLTWKIKHSTDFKGVEWNGHFQTFWENGQIKRDDIYKMGKLMGGKCFDLDGRKVRYYDFEVMPAYQGGEKELYKFIRHNIKYPDKERKDSIIGKIHIEFIVDKNGNLIDIGEKKGEHGNQDFINEGIRVVQSMPKWMPGMQDGIPVKVQMVLPMNFSLK